VHKTLGFLAVCSFVYRYAYVYPQLGHLGFGKGTLLDWATMAVRAALEPTVTSCTRVLERDRERGCGWRFGIPLLGHLYSLSLFTFVLSHAPALMRAGF
jgi:hypothetical protein